VLAQRQAGSQPSLNLSASQACSTMTKMYLAMAWQGLVEQWVR